MIFEENVETPKYAFSRNFENIFLEKHGYEEIREKIIDKNMVSRILETF